MAGSNLTQGNSLLVRHNLAVKRRGGGSGGGEQGDSR